MKLKLTVFALGVAAMAGCQHDTKKTPTQKEAAVTQWNQTRAAVLASLGKSQYEMGNLDKAQQSVAQALQLDPQNGSLHVMNAKLFIEQGQLDRADAELAVARQLDPKNAEADYFSGVVYQRWQKPQEAYECYTNAVAKNPKEVAYVMAQGEMLVAMNRAGEAIALLQSKVEFFQHNPVIYHAIGQLQVNQGRYAEGIDSLQQAVMLAGEDQTVREHLGMAYYYNHQYREAEEIFARLLKDDPATPRADLWLALGECQMQTAHVGDARSSFETATQLDPSSAGAWLNLAKAAIQLNDNRRAEIVLRKALALDGNSSEVHLMIGYLRLRENKMIDALAEFQKSSSLDHGDAVSLCMAGYVFEKAGNSDQAMKYYAQALKLKPNDELASKLMASVDLNN
jgi:tetratricopeptide (TPR) repeat protein